MMKSQVEQLALLQFADLSCCCFKLHAAAFRGGMVCRKNKDGRPVQQGTQAPLHQGRRDHAAAAVPWRLRCFSLPIWWFLPPMHVRWQWCRVWHEANSQIPKFSQCNLLEELNLFPFAKAKMKKIRTRTFIRCQEYASICLSKKKENRFT